MDWLIAPVIGLGLSSAVAYNIYAYRTLVIYRSTSVLRHLSCENGNITVNEGYSGFGLSYVVLTIKNYGFKNVKDFIFSAEESFNLRDSKVVNTTSVDAGAIAISHANGRLIVSCPYLPKNEKIEIELISDRMLSFWKVRGHGDQYRLHSHAYLRGVRGALSFIWTALSIAVILLLAGSLIGLLAAKS